MSQKWTIDKSKSLYRLKDWSGGFFDIKPNGNMSIAPLKDKTVSIDLRSVIKSLQKRNIQTPVLLRFTDIMERRLELICDCFQKAIRQNKFKGKYFPAYPIKVNQEKHLVEKMLQFGKKRKLFIECGSKPELLIAMGLKNPPRIICNGFKDNSYIYTALSFSKIENNVFIIVDRFSELEKIITIAKTLKVKPRIGLRLKLNSNTDGHWHGSNGHLSKFGLSSNEILKSINLLKKHKLLDALEVVHFHPGSQIKSILSIKKALREGAYLFAEIYKLGAKKLSFVDIGGGLGVNYGNSCVNYSEQEYANDAIYTLQSICEEKATPHPHIISESGRALIAHSSMLVVEAMESNSTYSNSKTKVRVNKNSSKQLKELVEMQNELKSENLNEVYHDLLEKRKEVEQLFSLGKLSLDERALSEKVIYQMCSQMLHLTKTNSEKYKHIHSSFKRELKDTYFLNFSIFQSLPDLWAIKQRFPITPLQDLQKEPDRWAQLVDLTCDSDGKIDSFIVSPDTDDSYLPIHPLNSKKKYYIGIFLTGAYQEILGDLHNLFGDTNAVHIYLDNKTWHIEHFIPGDSNADILKYVSYNPNDLVENVRNLAETAIKKKKILIQDFQKIVENYEKSISSITYLD